MKNAVLICALLASSSLFAFTEIRCDSFNSDNTSERVELNIRFNGSRDLRFGRAELIVDTNDGSEFYNFHVTKDRVSRMNQIEYRGPDIYLEIDTWPDRTMRPLRQYDTKLRTSRVDSRNADLRCALWP